MAGTPRGRPDWERTATRTAAAIVNQQVTVNPGLVTFGPFPVARWSKIMLGWRPAVIGVARMYYVTYAFTDVNGVAVTPNTLIPPQYDVLQGSPLWDQITVLGDQMTVTVDCTTHDADSVGTLTAFPVDASAPIGDFMGDGFLVVNLAAALGAGGVSEAFLPITARSKVAMVGFAVVAGIDFRVMAYNAIGTADFVLGYSSDTAGRFRYHTVIGALPRRTCSLHMTNTTAAAAFCWSTLTVVPD